MKIRLKNLILLSCLTFLFSIQTSFANETVNLSDNFDNDTGSLEDVDNWSEIEPSSGSIEVVNQAVQLDSFDLSPFGQPLAEMRRPLTGTINEKDLSLQARVESFDLLTFSIAGTDSLSFSLIDNQPGVGQTAFRLQLQRDRKMILAIFNSQTGITLQNQATIPKAFLNNPIFVEIRTVPPHPVTGEEFLEARAWLTTNPRPQAATVSFKLPAGTDVKPNLVSVEGRGNKESRFDDISITSNPARAPEVTVKTNGPEIDIEIYDDNSFFDLQLNTLKITATFMTPTGPLPIDVTAAFLQLIPTLITVEPLKLNNKQVTIKTQLTNFINLTAFFPITVEVTDSCGLTGTGSN